MSIPATHKGDDAVRSFVRSRSRSRVGSGPCGILGIAKKNPWCVSPMHNGLRQIMFMVMIKERENPDPEPKVEMDEEILPRKMRSGKQIPNRTIGNSLRRFDVGFLDVVVMIFFSSLLMV